MKTISINRYIHLCGAGRIALLLSFWVIASAISFAQGVPTQPDHSLASPTADSLNGVMQYEYIEERDSITYDHNQLTTGGPSSTAPINDTLFRKANTVDEYCAPRRLHSAVFKVSLDRGEDYEYGTNSFNA
ncbi:MAG: hypothetical protein ABI876_15660, partial [Bacteroidota bacterium]